MPPKFELLKNRDFGEIITDTFVFIRQNFKPLITSFITFCGFFILAGGILSAIQQTKAIGVVNEVAYSSGTPRMFGNSNPFNNIFNVEYFLAMGFLLLNYIAMPVTILSFMALYREKGGIAPTTQEVWGYFKYFFFRIFGSGVLLFLLLIIGFLLCLIPGLYLYPVFALIFPIIIFENTSFSYAFSKSFKLIKDKWWETFGALFVMGIIVYTAAAIVILPTTIINFGSLVLHPKHGVHLSVTLTVITAVLQSVCHIFYGVPIITIALCYFNLSEKMESTGLLGRINQLGQTNADDNLPKEEY